MSIAFYTFQPSLNDFLLPKRRNTLVSFNFENRVSVKDSIESLGVPHTEVEAVVVNGKAMDFGYLLENDDQLTVYGFFDTLPSIPLVALRPPLPAERRFVLDTHLGQLADYLRMFGFDTLYRNDYADDELARISSQEGRILLTRDKGLLKRGIVVHGYFVRETNPQRQMVEIVRRFDLADYIEPLRRCIRCNGVLQSVSKAEIAARLEPQTSQFYDEFSVCTSCDQIYWKGTHYQGMRQFITDVLGQK